MYTERPRFGPGPSCTFKALAANIRDVASTRMVVPSHRSMAGPLPPPALGHGLPPTTWYSVPITDISNAPGNVQK